MIRYGGGMSSAKAALESDTRVSCLNIIFVNSDHGMVICTAIVLKTMNNSCMIKLS